MSTKPGEVQYPPLGASDEYGFYAEQCFPIDSDRRRFFQELVDCATPHVGYHLLCLLIEAQLVKFVWTTNFDTLTARVGTQYDITPIEVGLDTSARVIRTPNQREFLHVDLHGDYRYDNLKNTVHELQEQDKTLREAFIQHACSSSVIVMGYSGRDTSVMAMFREAYQQPGDGRLYWCGYDEYEPPTLVRQLLDIARSSGREAYYIPAQGFDDLCIRLARHCLTGTQREKANTLIAAVEQQDGMPAFSLGEGSITGIMRSNLFQITCPREVLQFTVRTLNQKGAWERLRQYTVDREIEAVLQRGKVLALGTPEAISQAFGNDLDGQITPVPVDEHDLVQHGVINSLFTRAITRAIARSRGYHTDGRDCIWVSQASQTRIIDGSHYNIHDAAILSLRRYAGREFLAVMPTIKVLTTDGLPADRTVEEELKRQILTRQYNREFCGAINDWRSRLCSNAKEAFFFPDKEDGGTSPFILIKSPILSTVSHPTATKSITVPASIQPYVIFNSTTYPEPELLFSNRRGDGVIRDINPIRGITQQQPYDYPLTLNGISTVVRVGIVCPDAFTKPFNLFLNRLHAHVPPDSKAEYLMEYTGFSQVFGIPLDIPLPTSAGWVMCPDIGGSPSVQEGAALLAQSLIRSIDAVVASGNPNVVLVFIPTHWARWESYETEYETFDLHDFIKAYCVQRGITTQFIRQDTLSNRLRCEITWWLALSLYVKAFRTPWVLKELDRETAFVGLGFSIDKHAQRGQQILLGCSHIYNSNGLGLRYRLSKVDNAVIRHHNPFLTYEDAYRIGEMIRQQFYETWMMLPQRVVIHKRTPFHKDECQGLLSGLEGVANIDMVEISVDHELRYTPGRLNTNTRGLFTFEGDSFPVRRGTCLLLGYRKALLWTHGTAEAIQPNKRYYLGKSRIPAPLMLTRHHGTTDLSILAQEILGLSKMHWNSFDMYSRFPATIHSSNEIARIGALLERFGQVSYDYRLFI